MTILNPPMSGPGGRSFAASNISSQVAWRLLVWIGFAFVIMGGTDVALAWYPAAFGTPEWEFGAISATLNGLALPTLGIYLMLSGAAAQDQTKTARLVGTTMLMLAAGLVGLAFLYVTVVPLALNSVAGNQELSAGMRKAVVKAAILFLTYITLFVAGGVQGWSSRRT